jgi:hypothetical protein
MRRYVILSRSTATLHPAISSATRQMHTCPSTGVHTLCYILPVHRIVQPPLLRTMPSNVRRFRAATLPTFNHFFLSRLSVVSFCTLFGFSRFTPKSISRRFSISFSHCVQFPFILPSSFLAHSFIVSSVYSLPTFSSGLRYPSLVVGMSPYQ